MWGQTRRGSKGVWVANKQKKREEVRDNEVLAAALVALQNCSWNDFTFYCGLCRAQKTQNKVKGISFQLWMKTTRDLSQITPETPGIPSHKADTQRSSKVAPSSGQVIKTGLSHFCLNQFIFHHAAHHPWLLFDFPNLLFADGDSWNEAVTEFLLSFSCVPPDK